MLKSLLLEVWCWLFPSIDHLEEIDRTTDHEIFTLTTMVYVCKRRLIVETATVDDLGMYMPNMLKSMTAELQACLDYIMSGTPDNCRRYSPEVRRRCLEEFPAILRAYCKDHATTGYTE